MLAPMEGFSHPEFRSLVAEQGGLGIVCTEFVRITSAPVSRKFMARNVVKVDGLPLSVQVMGKELERMAEAAGLVAAAGADVVDVNLGCPTPRAVRGGVGAAMLRDLDLLHDVLSAMRREVPGQLSAKVRAGFDDVDGALAIVECVQAAGCDFVVLHPRKRSDVFRGVSDWRIIREAKQALQIPIVGNGDCWYASDLQRMQDETGCDGVMVGRPALRNPWIFRQAADLRAGRPVFRPSGADWMEYFRAVAERFRPRYGRKEHGLVSKLKELLRFLVRCHPDREAILSQALRLQTLEEVEAALEARFGSLPPDALDLGATGWPDGERSGSAEAR